MTGYTENQELLVSALDDTAEHVAWEFNEDEYTGSGTTGSANISGIDGRSSFVQTVRSASDNSDLGWISEGKDGKFRIEIGSIELSLGKSSVGYHLEVSDIKNIVSRRKMRKVDVSTRIHELVLQRLRMHGYLHDARLQSEK